jgi:hypothetical protein
MQERLRFGFRWLAWLSLSLVLWTAVSVLTIIPTRPNSNSCLICVVAHSTTPSASCNYARPIFEAISQLQRKSYREGLAQRL